MTGRVDVAVLGGGSAGIATAIAAARAGRATVLIDQRPRAGGTGGFSGLSTLCGLYDDAGLFLNEGFSREFAQAVGETPAVRMGRVWVLPYRPQRFRETAAALLAELPNLQCLWNTPLAGVEAQGDRIVRVNGMAVGAVVDCTGTAEAARAIHAPCLSTDESTQASAVLFTLCNVSRQLNTPEAMAQVLLPLARAGLPPMNFQPGLDPETLVVKFTGRPEQVGQVIEFLQTRVRGFEHCQTPTSEFVPAQRAGRMILGQYVLAGEEVLAGRKFPDAAARCAWPIEQWNAKGVARYRYLPPGTHYEIPERSLRCAGIRNLFMAGKTISADVDAIASARVMGCCVATGAAAGRLAAMSLEPSAAVRGTSDEALPPPVSADGDRPATDFA